MIHLIGSYYMTAGKNAYTVGEVEESRTKRVFKPGARYYSTLARAVAETAEIALRDKIAAGEITTLHDAVDTFRCQHWRPEGGLTMYRPFKKLRLRMVELDYNQKDLARAAGIVPSTFSLRIRGKQPFNSAQIAAIARVLNIPTSEIGTYFFEEPGRKMKVG